jgi:hypothetical protein
MNKKTIENIVLAFLGQNNVVTTNWESPFGDSQFVVSLKTGWKYEFHQIFNDSEDILRYEKISPHGERIRAGRVEFPPPWYI